MKIKNEILICLENVGIFIEYNDKNDINLVEYTDSITFVSLIIEIENTFNISIPDTYLSYETISSLKGFINLIEHLCMEGKR